MYELTATENQEIMQWSRDENERWLKGGGLTTTGVA